jgi:hypothetical protein
VGPDEVVFESALDSTPMTGESKPQSGVDAYRHSSGLIVICMICRRTLKPESNGTIWDRVEEFITAPLPGVSHGLCPDCLEEHYPKEQ